MRHIREFDGLRGLLALYVFLAHAIELGPYGWVEAHMRAFLAVDIFIILSGFVIFHLLTQGEDYGAFITRRFLRLFPVFAICFLLALLLRTWLPGIDPIAFALPPATKDLTPYLATHAMMLHGMVPEQWLPITATAILPPAWSISVEWQFYLVAPWFFGLFVRPRWTLVAGLFGLGLLRLLIERHSLGILFPGGPRDLTFQMNGFLPLKIELFAVGAISWLIWRRLSEGRLELPRAFGWVPIIGFPLVWCATGSFPIAVWTVVFAALIDAQFGGRAWLSRLTRAILEARLVRFLGKISYPFYLVHLPLTALVAYVLPHLGFSATAPMLAFTVIVVGGMATVAVAWLLHVTLEKPCIRWGKQLTARWKPQAETSALAARTSF